MGHPVNQQDIRVVFRLVPPPETEHRIEDREHPGVDDVVSAGIGNQELDRDVPRDGIQEPDCVDQHIHLVSPQIMCLQGRIAGVSRTNPMSSEKIQHSQAVLVQYRWHR